MSAEDDSGGDASGDGSGDGWLWLATGRGLYAYKPGRPLVTVVPDEDVRSVVASSVSASAPGEASGSSGSSRDGAGVDRGSPVSQQPRTPQAWCATAGGGVLKISLDEEFGAITARLDAEQGLPSQSAFAVLPLWDESATGREVSLFIGTTRGLVRYEPGSVAPILAPTRVTTSRPRQTEELREGLRLEYPQNSLVLDVAATGSRTFPEQFQYAFLLSDQEGQIIKRKLSNDSQFQVENLRAGRYRLVVRAYTIDLVSSAPLAFEFQVASAPFPWTTTALSVLLALSLVALLWGYVQHRKIVRTGGELMDANRQLAAARLQLANEAESERRRIARDLHDQTLADLRRLILLTDEVQLSGTAAGTPAAAVSGLGGASGQLTTLDPVVLRTEIESISHEIRRICEDLSPSVLENVGFVAALEWALTERVAHLPADCKFSYEFVCDDELEGRLRLSRAVQMQIYRIVQEAVSNVCRHAGATSVRLAVEVTGDEDLLLTLEDDGRGLPPENRKARLGRGLTNIRARASLIEAEVEWRKRPEGGTIFVLKKSAAGRADQTAAV
jgi:signal transduction histidine kinase